MKDKINLNTGYYFPWYLQFFGAILIIIGLVVLVESHNFLSLICIPVGILLIAMFHGLEIDRGQKKIDEYIGFLGFRKSHQFDYNSIERIVVFSTNMTQKLNSYTGRQHTTRYVLYKSYILLDSQEKVELYEKENLEKLLKKLNPLATSLGVEIRDLTQQ